MVTPENKNETPGKVKQANKIQYRCLESGHDHGHLKFQPPGPSEAP